MLAGCTAPGPEQTAAPTQEPSATTPAPEPADGPHPALPLTCAQLFSVDELQPLLTSRVAVRRDEASPALGLEGARLAVAGVTDCIIGGENRTDGSYDQGLSVQVVPDGAAVFDLLAEDETPGAAGIAGREFGDRSSLTCAADPAVARMECLGSFVVGDYWIQARVSDAAALAPDEAADLAEGIFSTIADRISAAGPARELWVPPASGGGTAALCDGPAAAEALLGTGAVEAVAWTYPQDRVGAEVTRCLWRDAAGSDVLLSVLPDGAWAFAPIAAAPAPEIIPLPVVAVPVDVPGTEGALLSCADGCTALLSVEGDLVQISLPSVYDVAYATERLRALSPLLG